MNQSRPFVMPARRDILRIGAGFAAIAIAPGIVGRASAGEPAWTSDPFVLGVAAGDPMPDGFVLWTRLAPDPLSPNGDTPGGMTGGDVTIAYEIASDDGFKTVVRRGKATAEARYAYSVHLEVTGLQPARTYWYRFQSGGAQSRVGRAITAPLPGSPLDKLRFSFVSCSNYEYGYFSAYRHLADEHPDFAVFLGDYIYEYAAVAGKPTVRQHSDGVEANDLRTYRNRYAQYKLDADCQRLHAEVPMLMTWDDHEVQNDYANEWSQTLDDPQAFLMRRAAAYRAFYEHMPLRPSLSQPNGPDMRVYDRYTFGDLAQFSVIDGRQYRSKPPCYGPDLKKARGHQESNASCPERLELQRTMIGAAQEDWLYDGLATSQSRWNVIAQDVCMAEIRQKRDDGSVGYWTDDWNGFPAARTRLLQHVHDSKVANPVVLTGDIHCFFANDLKLDFDNAASPTVATEFIGTSITSPAPAHEYFLKTLPDNPHIKFFDGRQRGYASVELTPGRCTTRYMAVSDVRDASATVSALKTFVVENGRPGAVDA